MPVLAIAYACNPYRGSEHGVGWGWVKMIASSRQVFVISADFERQDVERWLAENPAYRSRVAFYYPEHKPWHYHKESKLWVWIEHSPLKIIMNWAYRLWQLDAYRLAKKLHRGERFDLCHLITYVGFRFPGCFYQLDCPFVWGPVGGLENTPKQFFPLLGLYGAAYYYFRNLINAFDKRYLQHPKHAFKKAAETSSIIAATSAIKHEIKKWYGADSTIICEVGPPAIERDVFALNRKPEEPLRICWSGEHLPGKALPLLFAALEKLPDSAEWKLDVLGTGPCTLQWKKRAEELGLSSNCLFHGKLSRIEALKIMRSAHLFVITSLKDLTSTVLMEALSLGKPVIAPDHCGFSDVITENCGVKIPIDEIAQFVEALKETILYLFENEPERQRLACGAHDRIRDFSWEQKEVSLKRIYEKALTNSRRSY